ncbi:hypothetical protein QTJ16_002335 [Diplocarpon rosae]|uniref:ATP-grasp domain-containing protein n=1 Tax=Diplocarpon rosae TaxID=946125 RepID=A0AAD9T2T6_9HELO|nr:hypothetical protein QTJ16_002335 [Diplocarpon rosae]
MALSLTSPIYLHVLQNGSLILLSLCLFPLSTFVAVLSRIVSPYLKVTRHIKHHRRWREVSSATFRPRTILVTGIGMSKGLNIARAFYRAGHRVIGADFEPYLIPVCGHFSTSIAEFYRLSKPNSEQGSAKYIRDLVDIIKKEGVELWVPCSGIASGMQDGEAAEAIEKETKCKAIQFGLALMETLREKHFFIENTRKLGLNVPKSHLVTSETESLSVLYPEKPRATRQPNDKYIMKSVLPEEYNRSKMTQLPLPTLRETEAHIKRLNPTPFRPFVLQKFVKGPEYCTLSVIIGGKVKAFVVCPSAELPMKFTPLPTSSALSQAMLMYTTLYAEKSGKRMTGHLCINFLVEEEVARAAETRFGVEKGELGELMTKIYPIDCSPRVHTAVLCLSDVCEDLAEAYLSILPDHEPKGIANGHRREALVVPQPGGPAYYWIGHDLVTKVVLPVLGFLRFQIGLKEIAQAWMEFAEHILYWRDGTYEVWDPWPVWWLYVGYWPGMFLVSLWERNWWSWCHVSSGSMQAEWKSEANIDVIYKGAESVVS